MRLLSESLSRQWCQPSLPTTRRPALGTWQARRGQAAQVLPEAGTCMLPSWAVVLQMAMHASPGCPSPVRSTPAVSSRMCTWQPSLGRSLPPVSLHAHIAGSISTLQEVAALQGRSQKCARACILNSAGGHCK